MGETTAKGEREHTVLLLPEFVIYVIDSAGKQKRFLQVNRSPPERAPELKSQFRDVRGSNGGLHDD